MLIFFALNIDVDCSSSGHDKISLSTISNGSDQGLKNVTERNDTVLTVFFQKRNETKRKIFVKMRNEKKRNEIQRNETETKK
jgi:hypothetical protein